MKHDHPQFKLRLPPNLKSTLEGHAAANDRTLTAEIVARLEASLATAPNIPVVDGNRRMFSPSYTEEDLRELARSAGEAAARVVIAQATSLQPVHFGGGGIVQGPPPDAVPAPKKPAAKKPA